MISTDLEELGAGSAAALHDELHGLLFAAREHLLPSQAKEQPVSSAATLSDVIKSIVDLSSSDTVLILDHASRLTDQIGDHTLKALKAARDAVNAHPNSSGRFFLVAVDIDSRVLHKFTREPAAAFLGANVLELTEAEPRGIRFG